MSERSIVLPYRGGFPKIHPRAFVAPGAVVVGDVEIAEDASVWYQCVVRGDVNRIRIGARTNVQDGTIVHVTTAKWPTILGEDVTVGHRAVLHGCQIGDGALIGIGSIILDGAVIGAGAQVAAGALVSPRTEVPPGTLVMGVPAKVRRTLGDDEIADLRKQAHHYVELAHEHREER
ncbi:MAG: gamma carbonic anhydrase family protein [Deltaproteobacteria bacterium]|jgi:carbonic anhydrase/acetyltransferase-like protein (isoleucine patch superfamily)|nr:gamma carbonic anhydrase family protein [Deltaproteobacteria bacterium]